MLTSIMKGTVMIVFALAYLILSVRSSNLTELTQTQHVYGYKSKLIFSHESFDSQLLAYAVCTDTDVRQCEVFLKHMKWPGVSRSCNVTLKLANTVQPRVILLSSNKVILVSDTQETNDDEVTLMVRMFTINMDYCSVVSFDRKFPKYFAKYFSIVPRDENRYDSVIMKIDESFCRWEHYVEENRVSGPFDCIPQFVKERHYHGEPIVSDLPSMGYIMSTGQDEHFIAIDDKLLRTKDRPRSTENNENVTSTAHNKMSVCWSEESYTDCLQYDRTGEVVNNIYISHDATFAGGTAVHNLKSGGLIIVIGFCEEDCTEEHRLPTYYVSRYDGEGRRLNMTIVRDFKCDRNLYNVTLKFYENKGGKVCLTKACYGSVPVVTADGTSQTWSPSVDLINDCFD